MSSKLTEIDRKTQSWSKKEWDEFQSYSCRADSILWNDYQDQKAAYEYPYQLTFVMFIVTNLISRTDAIAAEISAFEEYRKIKKVSKQVNQI